MFMHFISFPKKKKYSFINGISIEYNIFILTLYCEIQNNHCGPPRTMLLVGKIKTEF